MQKRARSRCRKRTSTQRRTNKSRNKYTQDETRRYNGERNANANERRRVAAKAKRQSQHASGNQLLSAWIRYQSNQSNSSDCVPTATLNLVTKPYVRCYVIRPTFRSASVCPLRAQFRFGSKCRSTLASSRLVIRVRDTAWRSLLAH